MGFLLPQSRSGTVRRVSAVEIHGDRYVDLAVAFDAPPDASFSGRVPRSECPADLSVGDRVSVRFVMGVMVGVAREGEA